MLKSSLKTPSSIDHELFPLLTVRTCVSEADESQNGPRFCAEDKMTGAAYEVRSRRLNLEREVPTPPPVEEKVGEGSRAVSPSQERAQQQLQQQHQILSPANVQTIRRQQARIDALLSAAAQGTVPPSVALPIDIYIQEQPSTGDTYVASVDAFAGLSLGDIIRSGWGVMEEQVFLEILNAVEAYGYASATLPPHGNLSSDAIKQLLIVRDGASEARQPSRWVVSDWLLLSNEHTNAAAATAFHLESFIGDLEWMLHSSFAQLRISTSADGAYLAAAQVEEVINETVERIRTFLLQQAAAKEAAGAVTAEETDSGRSAAHAVPGASSTEGQPNDAADDSNTDKKEKSPTVASLDTLLSQIATNSAKSGASSTAGSAHVDPASQPIVSTADSQSARGIRNGTQQQTRNSPRQLREDDLQQLLPSEAAKDTTRNMTLKDKMAYHQAALRNEQLLVNKQRRKNAPLPPRPTPAANSGRRAAAAAAAATPKSSVDDDDVYYEVPSAGLPIQVKPSAYLMQGRRNSAAGGSARSGGNSARKLQSPRSARAPTSDGRTPREGSRSTNAATPLAAQDGKGTPQLPLSPSSRGQQQQQQPPQQPSSSTPRKLPTTPRDQRERLLDDVVNMAVANQSRRGQYLRMQQEADRRRRAERQHALAQNTPPRPAPGLAGLTQRTMPAVLERPRVVTAAATASSSNASAAPPPATATAATYEQQRGVIGRRSGTTTHPLSRTTNTNNVKNVGTSSSAAGSTLHQGNGDLGAPQAEDWPTNLSESPEPIPPSPDARRVVQDYEPRVPRAGAAPHYRTPLGTPRNRVAAGGAAGAAPTTTTNPTATTTTPLGQRGQLRGRGGVAAAGAPLSRPLRPTVGQRLRAGVPAGRATAAAGGVGAGRVHEVPATPRPKVGVNVMRSARGVATAAKATPTTASPAAAVHPAAPRVVNNKAGGSTSGHPLSARGKKPAAVPISAPPPQAKEVKAESVLNVEREEQPLQQTPYVKPLPLATLALHRNSLSSSPHAVAVSANPMATTAMTTTTQTAAAEAVGSGASPRDAAPHSSRNSPHGAQSSLSNTLHPPQSAGDSTRLPPPLPLANSPRVLQGATLGSGRGSPRVPHTARPPPPTPPAPSPRAYRRVASTGVLQSRTAKASSSALRPGNRVAAARFQYSASTRTPLSGRRDGGVGNGKGVVTHSPRAVPRKPVDVEGEKAFAAVNRKPMRRLVPEKVRLAHTVTSDVAQQSPRGAAEAAAMTTPRNRPTSGAAPASGRATKTHGYEKPTASNAARRKGPLTLGSVRPVNETSPGILLRHKGRAAV